ncbi:hypothetical protein K439DRAFT_1047845 [Ramaria rubella]|nr:hypothetical protein K439DRAFT_1047845 [Ramaria rubella]
MCRVQAAKLVFPEKQSAPTTPMREETLVNEKYVSEQDYRSGEVRRAILRDLGGSIPEVPIEWVLENIPRVACDLDSVKQRLLEEGHIKDGRWTDCPTDPIDSEFIEATAFKPFASMIEKIIGAAPACGSHPSHSTITLTVLRRQSDGTRRRVPTAILSVHLNLHIQILLHLGHQHLRPLSIVGMI